MNKNEMLSEDEKAVLRCLHRKWKWLARDGDNSLCAYEYKPSKKSNDLIWRCDKGIYAELYMFEHLFKAIKWEDAEPYSIEKLLEEEHITKVPTLKKLKDLTFEEYRKWEIKNCFYPLCNECPFKYVNCSPAGGDSCWVNAKNNYSDSFLDQEIEVD